LGYHIKFAKSTGQTIDGRYCVAGKNFFADSLLDLVTHFKGTPLNEEGDVLSIPCGQADENNPDFQHLLPDGAMVMEEATEGSETRYGQNAVGSTNSRPEMNMPPPALRGLKPGAQGDSEYAILPPPILRSNKPSLLPDGYY